MNNYPRYYLAGIFTGVAIVCFAFAALLHHSGEVAAAEKSCSSAGGVLVQPIGPKGTAPICAAIATVK